MIIVPLYSISVLNSAIVGYFVLFQQTTPPLKENMKTLVDILFEIINLINIHVSMYL
jgi:hypothetical protein